MSDRPTLGPASITVLALSLFVCCGATNANCNQAPVAPGPSTGEVVGIGVAIVGAVVATVVIIEVNHSHHTLKGCVYSTPSGLELRTSDQKVYALSGTTTNVAPGSTVRLNGDRQKHDKHAQGDQVFVVKELKKSYGPCTVLNASTTTPAPSPTSGTAANPTQP